MAGERALLYRFTSLKVGGGVRVGRGTPEGHGGGAVSAGRFDEELLGCREEVVTCTVSRGNSRAARERVGARGGNGRRRRRCDGLSRCGY